MTIIFSFHAANLGIIFQICKYLAEKHLRAGECQGAKKNEEKDTKKRKPRDDFRFLVLSLKQIREPSRDLQKNIEKTKRFPDYFSIKTVFYFIISSSFTGCMRMSQMASMNTVSASAS